MSKNTNKQDIINFFDNINIYTRKVQEKIICLNDIIYKNDSEYMLDIFTQNPELVVFFYSKANTNIDIVILLDDSSEEIKMFFSFNGYQVNIPITYEINVKNWVEQMNLEKRWNEIINTFFPHISEFNLFSFDSYQTKMFIENLWENFSTDNLKSSLWQELISILNRIVELNEINDLNIEEQALLYSKYKNNAYFLKKLWITFFEKNELFEIFKSQDSVLSIIDFDLIDFWLWEKHEEKLEQIFNIILTWNTTLPFDIKRMVWKYGLTHYEIIKIFSGIITWKEEIPFKMINYNISPDIEEKLNDMLKIHSNKKNTGIENFIMELLKISKNITIEDNIWSEFIEEVKQKIEKYLKKWLKEQILEIVKDKKLLFELTNRLKNISNDYVFYNIWNINNFSIKEKRLYLLVKFIQENIDIPIKLTLSDDYIKWLLNYLKIENLVDSKYYTKLNIHLNNELDRLDKESINKDTYSPYLTNKLETIIKNFVKIQKDF